MTASQMLILILFSFEIGLFKRKIDVHLTHKLLQAI